MTANRAAAAVQSGGAAIPAAMLRRARDGGGEPPRRVRQRSISGSACRVAQPRFRRGERVVYVREGSLAASAIVQQVHTDDPGEIYYTILLNGAERQTPEGRLRPETVELSSSDEDEVVVTRSVSREQRDREARANAIDLDAAATQEAASPRPAGGGSRGGGSGGGGSRGGGSGGGGSGGGSGGSRGGGSGGGGGGGGGSRGSGSSAFSAPRTVSRGAVAHTAASASATSAASAASAASAVSAASAASDATHAVMGLGELLHGVDSLLTKAALPSTPRSRLIDTSLIGG